jgi:hypothetical protein
MKRNRFVSLIVRLASSVNWNETVSFYLQAGQICIDWDAWVGHPAGEPGENYDENQQFEQGFRAE